MFSTRDDNLKIDMQVDDRIRGEARSVTVSIFIDRGDLAMNFVEMQQRMAQAMKLDGVALEANHLSIRTLAFSEMVKVGVVRVKMQAGLPVGLSLLAEPDASDSRQPASKVNFAFEGQTWSLTIIDP